MRTTGSIRLTMALALGLTIVLASTFMLVTGVAFGAPLQESHGDGEIISPVQTTSGTWGPGTLTATTDVLISPTAVITIAPHTTIRVADGKGLTVLGDLRSDGPVTFTTASSPAVPGAWKGITYTTGSQGYLDQVTIEYAQHALILSTTNPITISNSTIRYNRHAPASGEDAFGAGIAIVDGAHLVTNTQVYGNILVGSGAGSNAFGGGIDIQGSGSQVINSIIYSNVITSTEAFAIGGGIAIRGDGNASLIEGCQVMSNTVRALGVDDVTTYGEGGGIGFPVGSATRAVIRRNWIAGNINRSVVANGAGIGLSLDATADLIDSNIIYNNLCESPGGNPANMDNYWAEGGGIDTWGGANQVTVTNNLILSNTVRCINRCYSNTGPAGGGMMVNGDSAANPTRVINNTIVGNRAEGQTSGGHGGAIGAQTNGVFANNIIVGNSCTASNCGGAFYWWAGVSVGYGDLWNNSPNHYAGGITTLRPTDISQNPLFVGTGDLAQSYHLRQGSPAMDRGTSANAPAEDYDQQARPLGATWDMGFDEVQPFTYTKSVDLSTARGNDLLTYTVVVTNPDPNATFVSGLITDVLPSNTRYSSGPNCSLGVCGYDSGAKVITWTGNIPVNSVLNLSFAAQVDTGLADGTTITNSAFITVGTIGKTTDVVTTTIYNPAFTLTKQAMGTLAVGGPLTYTIGVTNTSLQAEGTNLVVNDTLPSGANYISGGALQGGVISWTIPSLPANSSAQVSFVVSTCQTSLTNDTFQVITSAQGIASPPGTPLVTALTPPNLFADFTHAPTLIATGDTVYLTSTSTTNGGPIVRWEWDFGDSQTGSGATTSHVYANMGTYTVTLTVTDTCGYVNTKASSIIVKANTTTTLASSPNPSALGQSVTFTATVSVVPPDAGTPTGNVNFYDGGLLLDSRTLDGSGQAVFTTSSLILGGHVITAAYTGDSNYNGSTSTALNQLVTDTPITNLTAVNDSPTTLGNATAFTATATGSNIVYSWDFGDGQTGSGANVSHIYAAVGNYIATVTATNGVSQVVATTPVTVLDTPITNLTAVNDSPTTLGNATAFTATATGSNIVYTWNFGDGATASGATVNHTYAAVGNYIATVTATNGVSQVVATTPVTVLDTPITNLTAVNDSPTTLGNATAFTATATGSNIVYAWNFGDGATASGATVNHTYAAVGNYIATVTATNGVSQVVATTPVTVLDTPITNLTAVNDSPTTLGNATAFTATATGSNIVYTWNFGDGATASGATVNHTYAAVGNYIATVTATNGVSQVVATTPVTITNLAPIANAGSDQTVVVGSIVTLDGSASTDPDGHLPLTYGWQQTGGTSVVLSSATISQPTFTAPSAPTVLTFSLVVTDARGLPSAAPDTVVITVTSAGLARIAISPKSAAITAGQSQTYTVQGFDSYGNSLGDVTASSSLTITPAAGGVWAGNIYTSQKAGVWTVTAQNGALTDTATLTVSHGLAALMTLSPGSYTLVAGNSVTYTVTATDSFGNSWNATSAAAYTITPGAGGTWSGNIYTSQITGSWTVTATVDGASGQAGLVVNHNVATVVALAPASRVVTAGDSVNYTVVATDTSGNSWDATGTAAYTITPGAGGTWAGNVYTSQIAGTWTVTATVGGKSGNATLYVNAGAPFALTLQANPATLMANGTSTSTITALVADQFGNPVADGTSVSFGATLGTVSTPHVTTNGRAVAIFTAGTQAGTATVTATANGRSGNVQLMLTQGLVDLSPSVKRASAATFASGELLTYTIILTNSGNSVAANLVVTDPIPVGATFVPGSLSGNGATYNTSQNRIEWNGTLQPGESAQFVYAITVRTHQVITITNRAFVSLGGVVDRILTVETQARPRYIYLPVVMRNVP